MALKTLKKTYRHWWQKPRSVHSVEEDRSVSFLELFYDLSYVIIIAQLTHALIGHFSLYGFVGFLGLFGLVWWAWVNGTFYHDLHGNNDIRTRVFTFVQMIALTGMSIFAHDALGSGYMGFTISYVLFLITISFLWWRTGVHEPEHSKVSDPYVFGFAVSTVLFISAIFVPVPYGFGVWALGTCFSLFIPFLVARKQRKSLPKTEMDTSFHITSSLAERFGLLTIILLGEIIVSLVNGLNKHPEKTFSLLGLAALGLLIAVGMWWVYFDFIPHHTPVQKRNTGLKWTYLHLPALASIALTGAGVTIALSKTSYILETHETWLLVGPVAVYLWCVALLIQTLELDESHKEIHRQGAMVAAVSGTVIIVLGFFNLSTPWLLGLINLFLLAPIFSAFRLWILKVHRSQLHKQANSETEDNL